MKIEKLISIIVPIYNVEKYLEECLNSIVSQTYVNLEIILVDDGSTDSCGLICDEWARKDKRIKVIHKDNGGLSSARNAGIEISAGEFITFIDSDDIVHKDMIKELYNCFVVNHNTQIAGCGYCEIKSNEDIPINLNKSDTVYLSGTQAIELMLNPKENFNVVVWNKLYRTVLFKSVRYPEGYNHEDMFVMPRLLNESRIVAYTPSQYYFHRYNPDSIVHRKYNIKSQDELLGVESMRDFFREVNNKDAIKKVNRIYLWKLIDHYCKTFYYIQDDKNEIKNKIKKKYDKVFKQTEMKGYTISDITQFFFFRWFSILYCQLREKKYK